MPKHDSLPFDTTDQAAHKLLDYTLGMEWGGGKMPIRAEFYME